jgi:hypothetical protein
MWKRKDGTVRRGLFALPVLLVVIAALSGFAVAEAAGAPTGPFGASNAGAGEGLSQSAQTTGAPTPIQHVLFVVLEDEPLSYIQKDNGYLWSLCSTFACDVSYYTVCHPSTPNYLALTAGRTLECGTDGRPTLTVPNMSTLVVAKGLTWAAYGESMPSPCDLSNSGLYTVHHVPMLFYSDVLNPKTYCDAHVTGFPSSWSTIPNFVFVTPNLLHDGNLPGSGGEKGIKDSDAWLSSWVPMIEKQSWYKSSVIFLMYDESANSDTSCPAGLTGGVSTTHCGGHVYLSIISPYAKHGMAYTTNTDEFDILTTTEWLLGLGNLGGSDAKGIAMSSVFTF